MKVLVVGEHRPGQLAWLCARGFTQLRVDTVALDTSASPLERYRNSYFPPLSIAANALQRLWTNHRLRQLAATVRPDLIFVLKGAEIARTSLDYVRQRQQNSVVIANWNPDSPLNPVNTTPSLLDSLPAYDHCFIWGRFLIDSIRQLGARVVHYLPFAYDPEMHAPRRLDAADQARWGNDIAFVGTWEMAREASLNAVVDCDLGIWGNHWQKLARGSPLRACWRGEAHGVKLSWVYSASRIALNFVRAQNGPAHNMRTFEAPACGILLLATRTPEQVELFGENVGAAFFDSSAELREKIEHYLNNQERRIAIAEAGRLRVCNGHTYADRMATVLRICQPN